MYATPVCFFFSLPFDLFISNTGKENSLFQPLKFVFRFPSFSTASQNNEKNEPNKSTILMTGTAKIAMMLATK